jgi:hypothetical protein
VLLTRLGLKPDSRAQINRALVNAKPGEVVRLADDSTLTKNANGSVSVTRGRQARVRSRGVESR